VEKNQLYYGDNLTVLRWLKPVPFQRRAAATFLYCKGVEAGLGHRRKGRLVMAKVIEFYIPKDFRKSARQVASAKRGQLIEFASRVPRRPPE